MRAPTTIWSIAATGRRSWRAFRGSPTGAATPSSRMRGLALATGRLDDAEAILRAWAATVSEGMLPNRFPDSGDTPEYNAVDASLWYVVAVHEFLRRGARPRDGLSTRHARRAARRDRRDPRGLSRAARASASACDADGLLAAGVPGVQLTWMDAKVGDWVVTPRIGKPVEIQALWINALRIAAGAMPRWARLADRATAQLSARAFPIPRPAVCRRRRCRPCAWPHRRARAAEPDLRRRRLAVSRARRRARLAAWSISSSARC